MNMYYGTLKSEEDIITQFGIIPEALTKYKVLYSTARHNKRTGNIIKIYGEVEILLLNRKDKKMYEVHANYFDLNSLNLSGQWKPYEVSQETVFKIMQEEFKQKVIDRMNED